MRIFIGSVLWESQKSPISSPYMPLCAWLVGLDALDAANDVASRAVL